MQNINALSEHILEAQFGKDILHPVGKLLIRKGPISVKEIVDDICLDSQVKVSAVSDQVQNVLTILQKHGLLITENNDFKHIVLYRFNTSECILRISVPRFIEPFAEKKWEYMILKEVYLAGCINKQQICQAIKYRMLSQKDQSYEVEDDKRVQAKVDELTLGQWLTTASIKKIVENDNERVYQTKLKKRNQKAERKQKVLEDIPAPVIEDTDFEAPLKLNMARFVAHERREAVIQMAKRKLGSEDPIVLKAFLVMTELEESNKGYQALTSLETSSELSGSLKQGQKQTHHNDPNSGLKDSDITDELKNQKQVTKDIDLVLRVLQEDSGDFVNKDGIDRFTQEGQYSINWRSAYENVQKQIADQIIHGTIGADHNRVMRVLRSKGFMQEKDLCKMCVLPTNRISSILNRLVVDGWVEYQEMPAVAGAGPPMTMYGCNYDKVTQRLGQQVAQGILNVLTRNGQLGVHTNLSRELNHLYFF